MSHPTLDEARRPDRSREVIAERYTVLGALGRGGTADVLRVRDELSGEELALKRLHVENPERRRRAAALFEREYYTLAQLAHPTMVRVFEYGTDERGAFYTMELLDGSDLLALAPLPFLEACNHLRDIASALCVLHSRRWLHRDLSPRNVIKTRRGPVKLLDFGAMTPMGVAKSLVGTPAVVPPEALQQQALDARTDLYSLGALAYYMLAGRHAFPARSFEELRDLWRSPVRPLDRFVPDIPPALSQLVLQLLSLDRFARPTSGALVIERLDVLLGGSSESGVRRVEAGRAFLSTPKLIGRARQLTRVRERMVDSLKGRGCSLLIAGKSGSGRSRFLDACVLEARLLGATVLRADTADAGGGAYSALASLGEQLVRARPREAREAARLRQPLLASVIPSLARHGAAPQADLAPQRRHLQTALRDWLREVARSKRIVIAVDDFEQIDEPSRAVLAALAHKSERRKLVLVATVTRDAAPSSGLSLMHDVALPINLRPLSAPDTEALLESLFGQAENVAPLAQRLFELSGGNPRQIMDLVEHLAERDLAHYASGSWTLPRQLGLEHLPASIDASLRARIEALSPQARSLAQALALTDPLALPFAQYSRLCDEDVSPRLFELLGDLVAAGVLAPDGERFRFTHARWATLLTERLDGGQARALHERLASALASTEDVFNTAHHLIESGQENKAVELMLRERRQFRFSHSDRALSLLERAVQAADALQLPRADRLQLQVHLVETSAARGQLSPFMRFAPAVLSELTRDCGLLHYAGLDPALPADERVRQALAAAQRENEQLPEDKRGVGPLRGLRLLADMAMACSQMASSALDPELLDLLPSLESFAQVLPSLRLVDLTVEASRHHLAGRFKRARAVYLQMLETLDARDQSGLNGKSRQRARLNVLYALGIFEAICGVQAALERAHELEREPGYRVSAWRIRTVYHASLGNLEQAQRCARRAQLLLLQDGGRPFPATDLQAEAAARFMTDDLAGLKQMRGRLAEASRLYPRRAAYEVLAHCHYLRVRGDARSALEHLQPTLRASSPERSVRFAWIGGTHLMLLNALERYDESVRHGRHYLEALRARGLELLDCTPIAAPLSEALAYADCTAEAVQLSEALIAEQEASGTTALVLGSCYETRARVALCARDAHGFEYWAQRCVTEYGRTQNSALATKLSQLLRDAQARHLLAPLAGYELANDEESEAGSAQDTVLSLMAECVDGRERARCALTLLLEECGATEGHLYGWLGGTLTHFGSVPDRPPPEQCVELAEQLIEAELRASDVTADAPTISCPPPRTSSLAAGLMPALLCTHRDGEPAIAGAVLLGLRPGADPPSGQLLSSLADALLVHDDVDALLRLQ